MARIVLHIGGEKTGSTYLQHWLHRNARQLLRGHGVYYPSASTLCVRRAHFPLAAALLPPAERDFLPGIGPAEPLFDELARRWRRSGAETLVLSAEHFGSRLDPGAIRRLRHLLPGQAQIDVVMYARWQDEVALSRYGTALRNGERLPFRADRIGPHDRAYNPWRVACDWSAAFGEDRVRVGDYRRATRHGLERDLLEQLRLPDDGRWQGVERANERLDCEQARLLQLLNRHLPTWHEALRQGQPERHRRSVRLRDRLLQHYRSRYPEPGAPITGLLPSQERQRLLERFAADNQRLAQRFELSTPGTAPAGATDRAPPACDQELGRRLEQVLDDAGLRLGRDGIDTRAWPRGLRHLGRYCRQRLAGLARPRGSTAPLSALATAATSLACCWN